ncbi:Shedu immune nuclease family protein [Flavobacterium sp. MMLR14_040]|uniref:Shedu immune nuclease family protein n=1 Tax=Flavobacterium sp. MMLR14_040 TaxID=3093843 RepID=UPI00298F9EF4|nr:Shedu immune nuclease family protein [Flavobacterium sp. MMLR14_040]MDW8852859.1 Shedu immune nuclease family protein [Flavobacterium sp. MMLR14_040]
MVTFEVVEDKIIFTYDYSDYSNSDWIRKSIKETGYINYKSTFHFIEEDLYNEDLSDDLELDPMSIFNIEFKPVSFIFAYIDGDYFKVKKGILSDIRNIYFHKDINLNLDYFVAETKISLFKQIISLIKEDIYIGGENINSIPFKTFEDLIKEFPNTYEKNLYADARITSTIKNYFETTIDSEKKFQNYINKKKSKKGKELNRIFQDYELLKYNTILEKLEEMLNSENSYNENQWQIEILEIILLLYPKYILSFTGVYITIDSKKKKFLDFMLVDSNGNIDVIEIKKPFENSIMSNNYYRNNYIPHKDLTGTVMQLEKYIYHLNRSGAAGEKRLNDKYSDRLPKELSIKITNPKGFIISGRENNLSPEQKSDFEVVKRKYKNVIDIITYDDLLQRLRFTIEQIKKI